MATRVVETYGNDPRPQYNVKFWTYVAIEIYETSATAYRLRYSFWVNANGSLGTLSTSWGKSGSVNGSGNFLNSGWIDAGWHSSGQTLSLTGWSGYTGNSGTYYRSTVSASYTVPQLQTVPQTPTSCSLVLNDNNTATISWVVAATATAPITTQKIGIQINDGSWSYTTLAASARTYTFDINQNSKYYCAVQAGNNIGWSAWKYSGVEYTNPLKPTYFATYDASNNIVVNLSSNSKYFKQFNLSYQVDENTWSDIIPVTTTTYIIPDTTTIYNNKLKVQEVNLGNKTTSWYEFIPSDRISILVNIPEGATPKSVWVKGPFAPPSLPYDVTFVKREDLPVHSLEQLTFSFSSDVRQLPSYFILCKEDGSPITKIPIEYDDDYTIVKNDNSYIYTDSNMINAIVAAFGITMPYKLGIKLGNTLGETAPVITDKALISNESSNNNLIYITENNDYTDCYKIIMDTSSDIPERILNYLSSNGYDGSHKYQVYSEKAGTQLEAIPSTGLGENFKLTLTKQNNMYHMEANLPKTLLQIGEVVKILFVIDGSTSESIEFITKTWDGIYDTL